MSSPRRPAQHGISSSLPDPSPVRRNELFWAVLILLGAGCAAYWNGFSGVFLLDDIAGIIENPRIHRLWPIWGVFEGSTRPFTDFTLAVNYALGGVKPLGYHAVNLAIHLMAGLVLLGLVRRTLDRSPFSEDTRRNSLWLAAGAALLWVLHPLQTQSVMYIIQRGESLMGLCYLLTFYCAVRWMDMGGLRWFWAAILSCALGMASKAIMVTAPLLVMGYDVLFMGGQDIKLRRPRLPLYAGLCATWLVLIVLLKDNPVEGASVGFNVEGISLWQYFVTQPGVILHYLRLAVWPDSLVVDYQWPIARDAATILATAIPLLLLIAATVYGFARRSAWAFLGLWFFVILAPSSSFIPVQDLAFEHRMYLSLAAVPVLFVTGAWLWMRRLGLPERPRKYLLAAIVLLLAAGGGVLTARRNLDYHSAVRIWSDNVSKRPGSWRGHNNLCSALQKEGRLEEGAGHCREALRLNPDYAKAHYNLGLILQDQGQPGEAAVHYAEAVRLLPKYPKAQNNLGLVLMTQGRLEEAAAHFTEALPYLVEAHYNLGLVRQKQGRWAEAVEHYKTTLGLRPDFPNAAEKLDVSLSELRKH